MPAQSAALLNGPEPSVAHEQFERADSECLRRMEAGIAAHVLPLAIDPASGPVRVRFGARTMVLVPLDTRRFVQVMARHMSFN